jgi:hypothetical protein
MQYDLSRSIIRYNVHTSSKAKPSVHGIRPYFREPERLLILQHEGDRISILEVHRIIGLYGQLVPAAMRTRVELERHQERVPFGS